MPLSDLDREVSTPAQAGPVSSSTQIDWTDWTQALERLWRCRRFIFWWTFGALLSSCVLAFVYPKYESQVQIMPPDSSSMGGLAMAAIPSLSKVPGLASLANDLLGAKNSSAVFVKVLESRTVQDDLITRFDLRKHYHIRHWIDTRKKLSSRTTISEDKKSGIIGLSVRDRDPVFAAALASAYIEELDRVVARVSTSSARRERVFLEQRLQEEKAILFDSEKQFSQFASNTMALNIPEQTKLTVEAAAKLQGELIAARAQLDGLLQVYTADNYRIRALRAHVSELERELGKINAGPQETGSAQDPTNPYPSVKSLPTLGVQWVEYYRNTKIHETVFELLTQQFELAKIQEAKEIPTVKVLDTPSTPEERYPRPWVIIFLGSIFGVVIGSLAVWLRDMWHFWSPEDHRRAFLVRAAYGTRSALMRRARWSRGNRSEGNLSEQHDLDEKYPGRRT